MPIKGKALGRRVENEFRRALKKHFLVFPKGISTPGVDVVAIRPGFALVAEVKATSKNKKVKVDRKQIKSLHDAKREIKRIFGSDFEVLELVVVNFPGGWVYVENPRGTVVVEPENPVDFSVLYNYILSKAGIIKTLKN